MAEFFEFQLGPRVVYQAYLVDALAPEIARLGGTRALMITDQNVVNAGMAQRVQASLTATIDMVGVFSDVPSHSSIAAVEQSAAAIRETGADILVAVGGGSPINTAKAARMLLAGGGRLRDYQGADLPNRRRMPLVVVPTTAGTGSEVSPFATIRDEEQCRNVTFASPFLAPDLAVMRWRMPSRRLSQRVRTLSATAWRCKRST
jgi:alcohol dehydrogenase class IV